MQSLKRTLLTESIRRALKVMTRTLLFPSRKDFITLLEGPGVKSLWIEPAQHLVHGQLKTWASISGVQPTRIPGYWLDGAGIDVPVGQPLQPGEKVLYHIHGGAYVGMTARPTSPIADVPRDLVRACKPFRRAFVIEYRLSSAEPGTAPANPFPAALLDVLAGYAYLTQTLGIPPDYICVSGDSAGGNAALALVRYLVEEQAYAVPAPTGSLLLLSPWSDLGSSHETPGSSMYTNQPFDTLPFSFVGGDAYAKRAFLGSLDGGELLNNPYISPASKECSSDFKGFPRTFISAGAREIFIDQIRTLKERMKADMGDGVVYDECSSGAHVFVGTPFMEPEKSEALGEIASWVERW